jgi:sulfite exporter TauE/SafE/copper chaperone CopZ
LFKLGGSSPSGGDKRLPSKTLNKKAGEMKQTFNIKGMHCHSCEILIEDAVKEVPGVKKVFASQKKNQVTVYGENYEKTAIGQAIKDSGYEVGTENLPLVNLGPAYLKELAIVGIIFAALYFFGSLLGIQKILIPGGSAATNLAVVFTIGLTAGLSTCMALVGGLVLGASARFAEKHPNATTIQKFRPHLFFNLGRIASYFVLGGVIGALGSTFRLSGSALGFLTILVGVVMFMVGIQLLEIFPRFSISFTLPKFIARLFKIKDRGEKEYSHLNSVILGALTFFLPCGFTQAMQVYAVTTGSFVRGALIMGVFAIGTTPGLLGVGGLTSFVKKGKFSNLFFKFVGLTVIALAIFNIGNGFNLTGINLTPAKTETKTEDTWRIVSGPKSNTGGGAVNPELQVIKGVYDPQTILTPKEYTVNVGKRVRFEILAKEDGEGCMGSVMIPGLANNPEFFQKDQTVTFEFTPQRTGKFRITCAMGLQAGIINVK